MTELKRRDLSGIYIFDTFPGEQKRQPTCIEDCQQETRRKWCLAQTQDCLRETISMLAKTFKDMTDYLVSEKCVSFEQRMELFKMIDRNVARSKYNFAVHELADQVDFLAEKVTMLADACGVTKHVDDEEPCVTSEDGHFIDDPLYIVNVKPDFSGMGIEPEPIKNKKV